MNLISINNFLASALQQPWTAIYTKVIAITLLYGATVHISNILGLGATPWLSTPLLWRFMDILLLVFDLVTAILLWQGTIWSIWLLFCGIILLQLIPYTFFRSYFVLQPQDAQVIDSLLGTEVLLLGILIVLLWSKK